MIKPINEWDISLRLFLPFTTWQVPLEEQDQFPLPEHMQSPLMLLRSSRCLVFHYFYVVFCGLVSLMSSFHVYNNVVYFTSTYECWTPPWYLPPVFNNIMLSFFDQSKANLNVWLKTKLFCVKKKCGGITRWNSLKHDIDSFKKCTSSKTTRYDNLLSKTEYLSRFFILVVNVWTFYCRWVITRPQIWCWLIEKL